MMSQASRDTRCSAAPTQVGTPTGLTFTDTGLTASTTYSYTVRAVDAHGKVSAASTAVSATTTAVTQDFTVAASPATLSRGARRHGLDHGGDQRAPTSPAR